MNCRTYKVSAHTVWFKNFAKALLCVHDKWWLMSAVAFISSITIFAYVAMLPWKVDLH